MDRREYAREIAELEHYEAKAWREFEQADKADLRDIANAAHRRQQHFLNRIMRVHEHWMSQLVRKDNVKRERLGA